MLESVRLRLVPVEASHALQFWEAVKAPAIYTFVPGDVPTLDQITARLTRWESTQSTDGKELWLNWSIFGKQENRLMGHFQVGIVLATRAAYIAYMLNPVFQKQGYAFEAAQLVIKYLATNHAVPEIRAWVDTRNTASIALCRRLGFEQERFIKDADAFKGHSSDEYVFLLKIMPS